MVLSVRRRIADIARAEPDRTALVGFDTDLAEQVLSWPEFADRVADATDALGAALDRRTRSCAVVLAGNTLPAAIGIAAALTAEVPVFPLNPGTPPAERDALLGLLGRRFAHAYLMDTQQRIDLPAGPEPPVGASAAAEGLGQSSTAAEGPGQFSTVAYLLATGASTGSPKISARPGPLRYDSVRMPSVVIRQTGWRTGQRQLIVGPLYHAAPFSAFLDALLDSNTVVLQPFFAPQWTVELVRRYAIEWLQLTPAHMREILRLPDPDPAGFASLRAMLHTASRCDADTKRGWIDLLGPERVYELYGATMPSRYRARSSRSRTATAPVLRCFWSTLTTGRSARTAGSPMRLARSSLCSASRRSASTPMRNPAAQCRRWPLPTSTRSGRYVPPVPICSAAVPSARRSPARWPPDSTTCGSWPRSTMNCWNHWTWCRTDVAPEFVARSLRVWQANQDAARDWRPSPYTGPVDVFGRRLATALLATVVQRTHECSTDGRLADALRELIG